MTEGVIGSEQGGKGKKKAKKKRKRKRKEKKKKTKRVMVLCVGMKILGRGQKG